jgi:hypothetical protein
MHEDSMFLTLTYRDEDLPENGSLVKKHLQDFMKRYRKKFGKVRFFACGEYGSKFRRPHYHVLIFGHRLDDLYQIATSGGMPLYDSPSLERVWGKGIVRIGECTFESAAYVARYITKKINGDLASSHYLTDVLDEETGELLQLLPEFTTMSLRPGIGSEWLDTYIKDVFPANEIIHEGRKFTIPRYYLKKLEQSNPILYKQVNKERRDKAQERQELDDFERLLAKEICAKARMMNKIRTYEEQV